MQLPGAERGFLGGGVLDRIENNAVQPDVARVPVIGVAIDHHAAARRPFFEEERTIADHVLRPGPRYRTIVEPAQLLDRSLMRRKPGGQGGRCREIGCGPGKGDLQCLIVRRADADLRKIDELAGVEGLGVSDREKHVRILRGEPGRKRTMNSEHKIVGGQGIAVAPTGAASEVEPPDQSIARCLPSLGSRRNRLGCDLIDPGQTLEQGDHYVEIIVGNDDVWIEIARLRTVSQMQHLVANARLDRRFAASATAGEENGAHQTEKKDG